MIRRCITIVLSTLVFSRLKSGDGTNVSHHHEAHGG